MQTVKVHIAPLLITGRMTTRIHFWLHLYIMAQTENHPYYKYVIFGVPKTSHFCHQQISLPKCADWPWEWWYGLTLAMIKSHPSSVLQLLGRPASNNWNNPTLTFGIIERWHQAGRASAEIFFVQWRHEEHCDAKRWDWNCHSALLVSIGG